MSKVNSNMAQKNVIKDEYSNPSAAASKNFDEDDKAGYDAGGYDQNAAYNGYDYEKGTYTAEDGTVYYGYYDE